MILLLDNFDGTGLLRDHVSDSGHVWANGIGGEIAGPRPTNEVGTLAGGELITQPLPGRAEFYTSFNMPAKYDIVLEVVIKNSPPNSYTFFDIYGPHNATDTSSFFADMQVDGAADVYLSIQNRGLPQALEFFPVVVGTHLWKVSIDTTAGTKTVFWDGVQIMQVTGGDFVTDRTIGFGLDNGGAEGATALTKLIIEVPEDAVAAPDRRSLVI